MKDLTVRHSQAFSSKFLTAIEQSCPQSPGWRSLWSSVTQWLVADMFHCQPTTTTQSLSSKQGGEAEKRALQIMEKAQEEVRKKATSLGVIKHLGSPASGSQLNSWTWSRGDPGGHCGTVCVHGISFCVLEKDGFDLIHLLFPVWA